jgi:4-oxalocrotonate tautomerase
MPLIHVRLFEGRTVEQKKAFAEAVTREAARTLNTTPESVDIIFEDIRKSDWATAGRLWSEPREG